MNMHSQLGDIKFINLFGPVGSESNITAAIAEHELIDGKPRLQRIGTNLETITLSINFHVSFCNPDAEYARLRTYLEDGEILPYIGGNGDVYGNFVIKSIDKTIRRTLPTGATVSMGVEVQLIEYATPVDSQPKPATFATTGDSPALSEPNITPAGSTLTASADAVAVSANANAAALTMGGMSVANTFRPKVERIIQQVDGVANGALKVKTAIDGNPDSELYTVTRQLSTACDAINTLASDILDDANQLLSDIDANNTGGIASGIAALVLASGQLIQRNKDMVAASAGLNQLIMTGNG